jgi:hypothetical protein
MAPAAFVAMQAKMINNIANNSKRLLLGGIVRVGSQLTPMLNYKASDPQLRVLLLKL